jgi:hypothetical protein
MNEVIKAVIDLMNGQRLFAQVTRGSLPTGPGIVCEPGPTTPSEVYLDKGQYIPLDLTINAKHSNLQRLTGDITRLFEALTRMTHYPHGQEWEIVDIAVYTMPQIIGREDNNKWLMAGSLSVRYHLTGE